MTRPPCERWIDGEPNVSLYKPVGIPAYELEEVVLQLDAYEAIRLCDLEGMYQEQAADRMGISRATLGRVLTAGRKVVARALTEGLVLRIEGGPVKCRPGRGRRMGACEKKKAQDKE